MRLLANENTCSLESCAPVCLVLSPRGIADRGKKADNVSVAPPLELRSVTGLLALQQLPRVGPATALRIALREDLNAVDRVSIDNAALTEVFEQASEEVERYRTAGVEIIAFFDERYPSALSEIADPPPLLFAKGNVGLLSHLRQIAVVGTREPSVFGETAAKAISAAVAGAGWSIVSGLAIGIDTIAHEAALAGDAPTVAILGNGLDRVYPKTNERLAQRIVESGGLLLSEVRFGAPAIARNLIARDRLQSGLAAGIVIAQTGINGGAMHTARFAAEQGRPIFCPVPHGENGKSEGLRVLLERPGRELCDLIPAWKQARTLCTRLGDRPVARPVARERMDVLLDELELARSRDAVDEQQSLLVPAHTEA